MAQKTIKELVEEAGVSLVPIGDGIYRGSSPFKVSVNHTPSFTVYISSNSWFDFGMSIGGDCAAFLARWKNISYRQAKEQLEGDTETLEIIQQTLDGLNVKDEVDYRDQLNFSISKWARDKMYQCPDKVDNIMKFLSKLDKEYLTKGPISAKLMAEILKEARQLEINP